jgi:hypothetical protein
VEEREEKERVKTGCKLTAGSDKVCEIDKWVMY